MNFYEIINNDFIQNAQRMQNIDAEIPMAERSGKNGIFFLKMKK